MAAEADGLYRLFVTWRGGRRRGGASAGEHARARRRYGRSQLADMEAGLEAVAEAALLKSRAWQQREYHGKQGRRWLKGALLRRALRQG